MIKLEDSRFIISVLVLWTFTVTLLIGMFTPYYPGFYLLSPLMTLIATGVILWNGSYKHIILPFLVLCGLGTLVEFLKVYGWLFTIYVYGDYMPGEKFYGIPIMMGLNWALFTYCTAGLSRGIFSNIWISSCFAAFLVVFLFALNGISAAEVGLWEIQNKAPFGLKYLDISVAAFIMQLFFQKKVASYHLGISIHVFSSILTFAIGYLFI